MTPANIVPLEFVDVDGTVVEGMGVDVTLIGMGYRLKDRSRYLAMAMIGPEIHKHEVTWVEVTLNPEPVYPHYPTPKLIRRLDPPVTREGKLELRIGDVIHELRGHLTCFEDYIHGGSEDVIPMKAIMQSVGKLASLAGELGRDTDYDKED